MSGVVDEPRSQDLVREYEPYEPYKSGRNSIASEDGIENEIASATLDGDQGDHIG